MHMEAEPFRHLLETAGLLRHVQVCDEGRSYQGRTASTSGASSSISTISVQRNRICGVPMESFSAEGGPALEFVRSASSTSANSHLRREPETLTDENKRKETP